jgi:hypothetical protein
MATSITNPRMVGRRARAPSAVSPDRAPCPAAADLLDEAGATLPATVHLFNHQGLKHRAAARSARRSSLNIRDTLSI